MADTGQAISTLEAATSAADADVLAGVQTGATKKFSFSVLLNYIKSKLLPADIGAVPNTRTVNSKALSADIALTAADVGAATTADIPAAYATNPEMDGAASAGSSTAWARGDHVHPADTSKADTDGSYRALTAGQILSDGKVEDKAPYLFRKSGGEVSVGSRENDTIVGGTVAWNQLVENGNFADSTGWGFGSLQPTTISNNKLTLTGTTTSYISVYRNFSKKMYKGHKYFISATVSSTAGKVMFLPTGLTAGGQKTFTGITTETVCAFVFEPSSDIDSIFGLRFTNTTSGTSEEVTITARHYMYIDLTQMFGSTIADYIAALETSHAGDGVAYFRKLFPKPYYAYNAGALLSVNASAHKTVGLNAWDEKWEVGSINSSGQNSSANDRIRSKNYIPVIPNTTYFLCSPTNIVVFYYDAAKNVLNNGTKNANETFTVPANAHYMRFRTGTNYGTTYNNDICINLSWDGERDGEYEPYELHTYTLDSSLTLRGIPKLDADNRMYYDGDTYEADGTVTRYYAERAYESGDESLPDAVTDGTTTVYKLTTPTTETADPFTTPQTVDTWGTEEYVVTEQSGVAVPVGHDTRYDKDLRGKLEAMPDSVPSTAAIAPTENGDTASQAYAQGKYFFRDGNFCKALTSIAAGASFTLNTNYAVTTIAAELYTALH